MAADEVGATATAVGDALNPDPVTDEFGDEVDISTEALADKYSGEDQKKWVKFSMVSERNRQNNFHFHDSTSFSSI